MGKCKQAGGQNGQTVMATMKVGLMGLGRGGRRIAAALLRSSWCELVAVGSKKKHVLTEFAEKHPGIATGDDFRSLIVGNRLQALFVAMPAHQRGPYLPLAAERGIPVWMLTPPARQFGEAARLAEIFEKAGCPLVVARDWTDEPALRKDSLEPESFGRWFLARGKVQLFWEENFDWRGDVRQAGGGVLLDQGYELIDLLVQLMGLPDSVYAAMAGVSRPGGRYSYDTEDTAAVICRFAGGAVATLHACWTAGPAEWSLELFGTQGSLVIEREQVLARDLSGAVRNRRQAQGGDPLAGQVEAFLSTLANPPPRFTSTLRQHLPAMAVMQAAYLSARTGQPESPSLIFKMHDVSETPTGYQPK